MSKNIFFLVIIILNGGYLAAQNYVYTKHWVTFIDKNNSIYNINNPEQFLGEKALERRRKQNISIQINDLPVNESYINNVKNLGVKILNISKWMNAITIETDDSTKIEAIKNLTFVKNLQPVYRTEIQAYQNPDEHTAIVKIIEQQNNETLYGNSFNQINMLHGDYLHAKGFKGEEITIGVFDSGFKNANIIEGFNHIFSSGKVLYYYDFVANESDVFNDDSHGTNVLSCIAGQVNNSLMGTAPEANFILFRTEDAPTENSVEEGNWIVAAEKADSMGVDIINSSLGYSTFDDPMMNHSYEDMNGKTTLISKAAAIASSKGIIVVNSAGNAGNSSWRYITAPADADSILAVGAVSAERTVTSFSSRGPSFDGRVKPDVCAQGRDAVLLSPTNELRTGNGTSFSSPILAGVTACFIQAFPNKTNHEIIKAIRESASVYNSPNDSLGYGIPDFRKAYTLAKNKADLFTPNIYPNPFNNDFTVSVHAFFQDEYTIQLFDYFGKEITTYKQIIKENEFADIKIESTNNLAKGMYLLKIQSNLYNNTLKVLKQ